MNVQPEQSSPKSPSKDGAAENSAPSPAVDTPETVASVPSYPRRDLQDEYFMKPTADENDSYGSDEDWWDENEKSKTAETPESSASGSSPSKDIPGAVAESPTKNIKETPASTSTATPTKSQIPSATQK